MDWKSDCEKGNAREVVYWGLRGGYSGIRRGIGGTVLIRAVGEGLERWLERRNRNGNKLPDEGYWKYCHNSKQA